MNKKQEKKKFRIIDNQGTIYHKSREPTAKVEKAHLPPLPGHLRKITNRPQRIKGALYHTLFSGAKKTIKRLEPRWREKELTIKELEEFYDATNQLVLCSRTQEDYYVEKHEGERGSCLGFLINLLDPLIKAEVHYFMDKQNIYKRIQQHGPKRFPQRKKEESGERGSSQIRLEKETWLKRAQELVKLEILGDQLLRPDRAEKIRPHFRESKPSEVRHLSLIDRRIKTSREKLLGTIQTEDQGGLVEIIESLLTNRSEGDDILRFFMADFISRPRAYDPYYLTLEEQCLLDDYEVIEKYYEEYNSGELERFKIKTKADLDSHIEKKELFEWDLDPSTGQWVKREVSVQEILSRIQEIPQRRSNLFKYLFHSEEEIRVGSSTKKSYKNRRLYYRLRDLRIFLDKPPKRRSKRFSNENEAWIFHEKVMKEDREATVEKMKDGCWVVRYTNYPKGEMPKEGRISISPKDREQSAWRVVQIPEETELLRDEDGTGYTPRELVYKEIEDDIKKRIIEKLPSMTHKKVFELLFLGGLEEQKIRSVLNLDQDDFNHLVNDLVETLKKNPDMKEAYREYCLITGRLG
jgi:hypothetical protein